MPPAADREGLRHPLSFRATSDSRAYLEKRASVAGRSVTHELEAIIDESRIRGPFDEALSGGGVASKHLLVQAAVLKRARNIAVAKGLSEKDARVVLRAATDFVADVYFSQGGPLPARPDPESKKLRKDSAAQRRAALAVIGFEAAEQFMFWEDNQMLEEAKAGLIANHWTGDGKEVRQTRDDFPPEGNAPDTPSLKEIMGR